MSDLTYKLNITAVPRGFYIENAVSNECLGVYEKENALEMIEFICKTFRLDDIIDFHSTEKENTNQLPKLPEKEIDTTEPLV